MNANLIKTGRRMYMRICLLGGGGDVLVSRRWLVSYLLDSDVRRRGSLRIVRRNTAQPIITFPEGRFRGLGGSGGFGEAAVACDMLKPCKFPSRDNCQKRFLWPTKKLILLRAQSLVLCSKFKVGDAKEFPQALGFESLDPIFFSESASSVLVSRS